MSGPAQIDATEAARTAEQVGQVDQVDQVEQGAGPGNSEGNFADTEQLVESWKQRLSALESKRSSSSTAPPPSSEDVDELQSIAEGVVRYRQQLLDDCGYRKKDLKEDPDLPGLEARLDELAKTLLPGQSLMSTEREENALLAWARQQTQKLADLTQQSTNLSPSERKEVEELVTEMVELKARFGAEGLTRHDQEKHDDMQRCMWRLRELRQKDHRDKKHDGRQQPEAKAVKEEAEKLKAQIAEHKKRLMEEKGLSQKEAKEDAVLAELEQTYNAICQVAGA